MVEPLDFALIKRLREVLESRPATESELRTLSEQADAWERALTGQIEASERRLRRQTPRARWRRSRRSCAASKSCGHS
jgi:hypothetical protein